MLALTLVFSVLFVIFGVMIGFLFGWATKQHLSQREPYTYHPEMFDENGNVLPDELIAFRFENTDMLEEDEDSED
jgi:hypothetical protein